MKRLIPVVVLLLLSLLSSCSEAGMQTSSPASDMTSHTEFSIAPSEAPYIDDGYDDYK